MRAIFDAANMADQMPAKAHTAQEGALYQMKQRTQTVAASMVKAMGGGTMLGTTQPSKRAEGLTVRLARVWRWIRSQQISRLNARRIHVAATASLGDKRFVAVIKVDDAEFLVGWGATSIVLLAHLDDTDVSGSEVSERTCSRDAQLLDEKALV